MGMHFGVVATMGTADELLDALSAYGTFRPGPAIAAVADAPEVDAAGERVLIAGDHDGRAYLLDDSLLIASSVDLLVDASRRLGRRLLTILAETTSGTYVLIATDGGRVERLHWTQLGGVSRPYDIGPPLAGEARDGLDDIDGDRLRAVHAAAGFDFEAWIERGRKFVVEATYGEPIAGADGSALSAFMSENAIPGAEKTTPVVAKRPSGFDLVAPGTRMPDGTRVGERTGGGLLGRLFGRG